MIKSDWNRVAEIYSQALLEGISTFNTECPMYEAWDKNHIKECRYVCELNEVVTGWIAISPVSARPAYRGCVEISVYVDSEYRGRGIGTELITKLVDEASKEGYWSFYSAIFSVNEASIALHRKCGFR